MRKLFFLAFTVLAVTVLVSCKNDCKNCRWVTYEDGVKISEDSPAEYCGSQLNNVDGQTATVGNRTTVMVCN
ncbi:MAG: hypothetical protein WCM76_03895 [Bacteroidota bacterium]